MLGVQPAFRPGPAGLSIVLNTLALLGVVGALAFAFAWQFLYNELPCPLCLLQRVAFIMAGVGLLLNVRFGASPLHYAVVLASALGGAAASMRQVLLHIAPGDAGYGMAFLGMHFYTWALVSFVALMVYCTVMLAVDRRQADNPEPRAAGTVAVAVMWLFFAVAAANVLFTTLECGFGACPDDPTEYLWLP